MNLFEKFLVLIDGDMPTPETYGWYHILCLFLVAGITFILVKFFANCENKTFRNILLITWVVLLILEAYKQLNYSFNEETGEWSYDWYFFPYQFCSTPLYVLPFCIFLKDGKARDAFLAYTMSYAFFAGLAVMLYPGDVFTENTGVNIQTMVHHGSQVFIGIFVAVHERKKYSFKFFFNALYVFIATVIIALAFNIIGKDLGLNMFYVGPYQPCTLPILNLIYPEVPWVVFFIIYVVGFSLISALVFYICNVIYLKGGKTTKSENLAENQTAIEGSANE